MPKRPRKARVPPGLRLQYLVVLAGTDPLVWRRIQVPATYSFWDLHVAIQDAMGWLDCHLHQFLALDPRSGTTVLLGIPDRDLPDDRSVTASWTEFPIDYVAGDPPPMQYTYDFRRQLAARCPLRGLRAGRRASQEARLTGRCRRMPAGGFRRCSCLRRPARRAGRP